MKLKIISQKLTECCYHTTLKSSCKIGRATVYTAVALPWLDCHWTTGVVQPQRETDVAYRVGEVFPVIQEASRKEPMILTLRLKWKSCIVSVPIQFRKFNCITFPSLEVMQRFGRTADCIRHFDHHELLVTHIHLWCISTVRKMKRYIKCCYTFSRIL